MTLPELRDALQDTTGTDITKVIVDAFQSWNESREVADAKTYPTVIWNLASAKFEKDARLEATKMKLTMDLWVIGAFSEGDDKLTIWNQIGLQLDEYLRAANTRSPGFHLPKIGEIKGEYFWEGSTSGDSEVGIEYQAVEIEVTCYQVP